MHHRVQGKKKVEYRETPLPKNKFNIPILILTPTENGRLVVGQVVFVGDHVNCGSYEWIVRNPVEYDRKWRYKPKQGCVMWMKDVEYDNEASKQITLQNNGNDHNR